MKKIRVGKIEVKFGKETVVLSLDEARELHRVLSGLLGKGDANVVRLPPGFPKKFNEPIDISPPRYPIRRPWPFSQVSSSGIEDCITICGTIR